MEEQNTESEVSLSNALNGDSALSEAFESVGLSSEDLEGPGVQAKEFDGEVSGQDVESPELDTDLSEDGEEDVIGSFLSDLNEDDEDNLELESQDEVALDGLLESVNALGLVHNGDVFEVGSQDELKSLLQKGRDYTVKTQSLADERKSWDSEKEVAINEYNKSIEELNKSVAEHQQMLQDYQIVDLALAQIKEEDPDQFAYFQEKAMQAKRFVSNPVMDQQMKQMQEKLAAVEKQTKERENNLIMKEFEKDFELSLPLINQLQSELNLVIDKDKVKARWAQGDDVKQALGALYGDKVMRLRASKQKVAKTKSVAKKKVGGAGAAARQGKASGKAKISWKGKSYQDIVGQLANKL